ncbi:MAG: hypothetical protein U1C55_12515, partial [Smithellaceae bacterium]|nr:hypothetical protein [Smithellaceae bacterium]
VKTAPTERGPPKGMENGNVWRVEGRAPSRPQEFCNWLDVSIDRPGGLFYLVPQLWLSKQIKETGSGLNTNIVKS